MEVQPQVQRIQWALTDSKDREASRGVPLWARHGASSPLPNFVGCLAPRRRSSAPPARPVVPKTERKSVIAEAVFSSDRNKSYPPGAVLEAGHRAPVDGALWRVDYHIRFLECVLSHAVVRE